MKKMTITLMVLLTMIIGGCGTTTTKNETKETTKTEIEKTEVSEMPEISESLEEEVIGDTDITGHITMADLQELTLGLDIPVVDDEAYLALYNTFGRDDIKILFPGGAYITSQIPGNTRADLETIDIIITNSTVKGPSPEFVKEDEILENVGNYVIYTNSIIDSDLKTNRTYFIFDNEKNVGIMIGLLINKNADYLDENNAFIEEYIPAFEETLKNNFR